MVGRHAHPEDGTALRPGVKHPSAPAGHRHGAVDAVVAILKLPAIAAIEALHSRLTVPGLAIPGLAVPGLAVIVLPVVAPPVILTITVTTLTIAAAVAAVITIFTGRQNHYGLVRTGAQGHRLRRRNGRRGQGRRKRRGGQRKTKKGPNLFHDTGYKTTDLNLI